MAKKKTATKAKATGHPNPAVQALRDHNAARLKAREAGTYEEPGAAPGRIDTEPSKSEGVERPTDSEVPEEG